MKVVLALMFAMWCASMCFVAFFVSLFKVLVLFGALNVVFSRTGVVLFGACLVVHFFWLREYYFVSLSCRLLDFPVVLARFVGLSIVGAAHSVVVGANGVACICSHMWFTSCWSGFSGHVHVGQVKLPYRSPRCSSRIPLGVFFTEVRARNWCSRNGSPSVFARPSLMLV